MVDFLYSILFDCNIHIINQKLLVIIYSYIILLVLNCNSHTYQMTGYNLPLHNIACYSGEHKCDLNILLTSSKSSWIMCCIFEFINVYFLNVFKISCKFNFAIIEIINRYLLCAFLYNKFNIRYLLLCGYSWA